MAQPTMARPSNTGRVATRKPGHQAQRGPLALRAALLFALVAVPLSTSSAQGTAVSAESTGFAAQFAEVVPPLGPDLQGLDLAVPADAVDIDSFDPPVEDERSVAQPLGTGVASYYGQRFHGRRTASGEAFDMRAMTAAHRTLPFGSLVRVSNPANGRSVTVRINDRGPYAHGRTIDVSRAAAEELGLVARGHGTVELELIAS